MYIKSFLTTIALATSMVSAATTTAATSTSTSTTTTTSNMKIQDYWKSFTSSVDPNKIQLPKISQTTSNDPATECTYYEPPAEFKYDPKQWPNLWETATSNGMDKTAEFTKIYNAIDWSKKPNIPQRKMTKDGGLDFTGYDGDKDPDCWWSSSTCTKPKHTSAINADIYQCPEPNTWGLNYDDGPNCSHNAFYDFLEQKKLKASMFYIGSNVVNWPYGAMRGMKNGHHIADHTWSHQLMTTLNDKEVLAELYYTQKAIKLVTGVTPKHWRPAFGDVDDRVRWIATQLGLTTILWDKDTDDWNSETPELLNKVQGAYDDFIKMGTNGTYATSGNIVLTHEINNTTMSLAVKNLPNIMKSYKHVVDIATCMNITYPYQETTVKFPSFDEFTKGQTANSVGTDSSNSSSTSSSSSSTPKDNTQSANQSSDKTSAGIQIVPTFGFAAATLMTIFATLI